MQCMIHKALNKLALSSTLTRRVTYALSSQLAYVLTLWAAISLYKHNSQEFMYLAFLSFGGAGIARLIVEGIYICYKRPRPSVEKGITPLFINTNPSFPSGHATFFGALSSALVLLDIPTAFGLSIATFVMCVARVAAGVHFFSDILGGTLIGVGTVLMAFAFLGVY